MTARVKKTAARAAAPRSTVATAPRSSTTSTSRPTAVATPEWARQQRKLALQLVESLEDRGLLDQDEIQRLREQAEDLAAERTPATALQKVGAFQKKVTTCLEPESRVTDAMRNRKLEALFEINRQISRLSDPTECFDRVLELLRRVVEYEGATLFLADAADDRLKAVATTGAEIDLIERIEFDNGLGFSGWVARTQKPILFGSLKKSQPTHRGVIKSFMAAPVVVAGRTIGVLTLGHSRENAFDRDDLRLLVMVGTQVAALVQKVILEERLRQVAIVDEATGLYNRSHFLLRVQDEAARAARFMQEFALVTLEVNDFAGYLESAGDDSAGRAMIELAGAIRGVARGTDLVARTGESAFSLLLPVTNRDEAEAAAQRLARAVDTHVFPRRKRLTATTGVAVFPDDGTDPQELLSSADKAVENARREIESPMTEVSAMTA